MDGSLVLDIPNNAILAMDDPDVEGRWVCKMADHIFLTFEVGERSGTGEMDRFDLHEVYSLPHREAPEADPGDVPPDLLPCLGKYHFASLNADFVVDWDRGGLKLQAPRTDRAFNLRPADGEGTWKSEHGPFTVSFVKGVDGRVASMTLDSTSEFERK